MKHIQLAAAHFALDRAARTITGQVVQYGVRGPASLPAIFEHGSLEYAEPRRIKLLLDHDHRDPVGYATAADDDDNGLVLTFAIPQTDRGDYALEQAANGLRDGLSVGVTFDDDGGKWDRAASAFRITKAHLHETSLVACPAFDNARVTDVSAQLTTLTELSKTGNSKEGTPMDPENTSQLTAAHEPPEPPAAPQPPVIEPIAAQNADPLIATTTPGASLATVEATIGEAIRTGKYRNIEAQLQELTPNPDYADPYFRPQWIGELWEATKYSRQFIETIGNIRRLISPIMMVT